MKKTKGMMFLMEKIYENRMTKLMLANYKTKLSRGGVNMVEHTTCVGCGFLLHSGEMQYFRKDVSRSFRKRLPCIVVESQ